MGLVPSICASSKAAPLNAELGRFDAKQAGVLLAGLDLNHVDDPHVTLWRMETKHAAAGDYVVSTSTGKKHNPSNLAPRRSRKGR